MTDRENLPHLAQPTDEAVEMSNALADVASFRECLIAALRTVRVQSSGRGADHAGEAVDAFCAECQSLMVEDNGAGHLCPACDQHPTSECGTGFPCSGEELMDGSHRPCVLNRQIGEPRRRCGACRDLGGDHTQSEGCRFADEGRGR